MVAKPRALQHPSRGSRIDHQAVRSVILLKPGLSVVNLRSNHSAYSRSMQEFTLFVTKERGAELPPPVWLRSTNIPSKAPGTAQVHGDIRVSRGGSVGSGGQDRPENEWYTCQCCSGRTELILFAAASPPITTCDTSVVRGVGVTSASVPITGVHLGAAPTSSGRSSTSRIAR